MRKRETVTTEEKDDNKNEEKVEKTRSIWMRNIMKTHYGFEKEGKRGKNIMKI